MFHLRGVLETRYRYNHNRESLQTLETSGKLGSTSSRVQLPADDDTYRRADYTTQRYRLLTRFYFRLLGDDAILHTFDRLADILKMLKQHETSSAPLRLAWDGTEPA